MSWDGPERYTVHFRCEVHDKEAHPSRWSAKHAARGLHGRGLREYRCSEHAGWWHNGHMPACVRRGDMTMYEWFGLPVQERRRATRRDRRA